MLRPPWYDPAPHVDFLAVCFPELGSAHALTNLASVALCPFWAHCLTELLRRKGLTCVQRTYIVTLIWPQSTLASSAAIQQLCASAAEIHKDRERLSTIVTVPKFHPCAKELSVDVMYPGSPSTLPVSSLVSLDDPSSHAKFNAELGCVLNRICDRHQPATRDTNRQVTTTRAPMLLNSLTLSLILVNPHIPDPPLR